MRRISCVLAIAILAGCGGDSGGSSAPILARLHLKDGSGAVLSSLPAGTKVLIDGEEISNASVALLAAPPVPKAKSSKAAGSNLTIYVPGYGGFDDPDADPAAGITVQLIKRDLLNNLFVFSPTPDRVLVGDPAIAGTPAATMCVKGVSKVNAASALRFDVVLVVDRSASTLRDSGVDVDGDDINDSVLKTQCESLRRYIDALRGTVKIGVIAFEGGADVIQTLTEDKELAKDALDLIEAGGSLGGTDFQEAILAAELLLTTDLNRTTLTVTLENELGEETDTTVNAPRMIIFCSDGVPTLPSGSGISQQLEDRVATLDAARAVMASQIVINSVAFGPAASLSKLTTMPAMAAITGGVYTSGDDFLDLASDPTIFGFSDVIGVNVWNASKGEAPGQAAFSPDGIFQRQVGWQYGDNDIHVQLVTRESSLSVSMNFNVKVVTPAQSGLDALLAVPNMLPTLTESTFRTPDGKPLGGTEMKGLFLNPSKQVYTDLKHYPGMETFEMTGATGPVQIQVAAKFSDYSSDFGFVEYDPANPPATAKALLSNGTAVKIANTSAFGTSKKFEQYAPDTDPYRFNFTMTTGKHYAFWTIPNGTLANYLANQPTRAPLITVSKYNPIGADHYLTYVSELGRATTSHGRSMVLCLEDIATIDQSDRDFNDIVFEVIVPPALVQPKIASPRCD